MTGVDVERAILAFVDAQIITGLPWVYPNEGVTPGRPYATVQLALADPVDRSLTGGAAIQDGTLTLVVVTEENEGAQLSRTYAAAIEAIFAFPTTITAETGTIKTTRLPQVKDGFNQGGGFRRPILIPFTAT